MNYLILVSHGDFAKGLKSSVGMFAGDKVDQVIALGLADGQSMDAFMEMCRKMLLQINEADSLLVLADIVGGSPLTAVSSVLAELGKLDSALILGGMNLPMALTATVLKDSLTGQDLLEAILKEAQAALQVADMSFATETVEEDI
ncbi:PTS sugar transporter subunit IIA [Streptococcus halichoeri]|uniref:PTS sugar transporter subunit IIA n=1 Tax=Streptococcus halichoeri TaxID=254785 RepID=UPI00135ADB5A|nr:PTS fructose transporter subunit IIA [Streptococcus halichoeri]